MKLDIRKLRRKLRRHYTQCHWSKGEGCFDKAYFDVEAVPYCKKHTRMLIAMFKDS